MFIFCPKIAFDCCLFIMVEFFFPLSSFLFLVKLAPIIDTDGSLWTMILRGPKGRRCISIIDSCYYHSINDSIFKQSYIVQSFVDLFLFSLIQKLHLYLMHFRHRHFSFYVITSQRTSIIRTLFSDYKNTDRQSNRQTRRQGLMQ